MLMWQSKMNMKWRRNNKMYEFMELISWFNEYAMVSQIVGRWKIDKYNTQRGCWVDANRWVELSQERKRARKRREWTSMIHGIKIFFFVCIILIHTHTQNEITPIICLCVCVCGLRNRSWAVLYCRYKLSDSRWEIIFGLCLCVCVEIARYFCLKTNWERVYERERLIHF